MWQLKLVHNSNCDKNKILTKNKLWFLVWATQQLDKVMRWNQGSLWRYWYVLRNCFTHIHNPVWNLYTDITRDRLLGITFLSGLIWGLASVAQKLAWYCKNTFVLKYLSANKSTDQSWILMIIYILPFFFYIYLW